MQCAATETRDNQNMKEPASVLKTNAKRWVRQEKIPANRFMAISSLITLSKKC